VSPYVFLEYFSRVINVLHKTNCPAIVRLFRKEIGWLELKDPFDIARPDVGK
jgi:hypothetical protein